MQGIWHNNAFFELLKQKGDTKRVALDESSPLRFSLYCNGHIDWFQKKTARITTVLFHVGWPGACAQLQLFLLTPYRSQFPEENVEVVSTQSLG